jgi:hypothetical protein
MARIGLYEDLLAVALATVGLLAWVNQQPHASALEAEGPAPSCSGEEPTNGSVLGSRQGGPTGGSA